MIVITLRQDDNTSITYSEEFMFEFTKWCGVNFVRLHGGWIHRYSQQIKENLRTTKELLEQFKKLKDGTTRQT